MNASKSKNDSNHILKFWNQYKYAILLFLTFLSLMISATILIINHERPREVGTLLVRNFDNEESVKIRIMYSPKGLNYILENEIPVSASIRSVKCKYGNELQLSVMHEGDMIEYSKDGGRDWWQLDYQKVVSITADIKGNIQITDIESKWLELNPC